MKETSSPKMLRTIGKFALGDRFHGDGSRRERAANGVEVTIRYPV
jgi:hypothetical protein